MDYFRVQGERLPKSPTRLLFLESETGPAAPSTAFLDKLAQLGATEVRVSRRLTQPLMAAISRMPSLEVLEVNVSWEPDVRLGPAPRLKALSAGMVPDLAHLAALPALERLSLDVPERMGPFDLASLSVLPALKSLWFSGRCSSLEPLTMLPALETLSLSLKERGGPEFDSAARLDPTPLGRLSWLTSLSVLNLRPCSLALFAGMTRLERLSLYWRSPHGHASEPCVDAASLGGLRTLRGLDLWGPLGFDDAVAMLVALADNAPDASRVRLNCGLPALLEPSASAPLASTHATVARALKGSSLPRIVPQPATPPEPKALKKALAPVREAMKRAEDPRTIVVALRALDRAALEVVGAGTGLDADAKLVFGPYLEKECRAKDRAEVALYLLDMLGQLDGVRALDLEGHKGLMDLGALERHLGTLEVLMLKDCTRLGKVSGADNPYEIPRAFVGADPVRAAVEAALKLRTPFDWPRGEDDGPELPPELVALFETPDPEALLQAVYLAASLGLASRLLTDCTADASCDFGLRRAGLLRHRCPDCGGTGHVSQAARARKVAQSALRETRCPSCDGKGEPPKAAEAMTLAVLALLAALPAGDPTASRLVGALTEVRVPASQTTLTQLAWLKHARALTTLEAPWSLCEPELALLQGLPALSRLELSGLPADLSPVAGFAGLKTLVLGGGGTVDGRHLAGLDALEALSRGGVTLTNPQALAALPKLKTLR